MIKHTFPLWLIFAGLAIFGNVIHISAFKLGQGHVFIIIFVLAAILSEFVTQGFLYLGTRKKLAKHPITKHTVKLAALLAVCGWIGYYCGFFIFENGAPLSVAMPILSVGSNLLIVLFGVVILKEHLSKRKMIGMAFAVAGIILLKM